MLDLVFFPEPFLSLELGLVSDQTKKFSIKNDDEAREFLRNKMIRVEYKKMIKRLIEKLKEKPEYFNGEQDRRKMRTSIDYFLGITKANYDKEIHDLLKQLKLAAEL